jgi:HEAT repeat protein
MSTVKPLLVQMSSEANIERRAGTEGLDAMEPSAVDPYLTAALESGTDAEKRGAAAYLISRVTLQDNAMLAALIAALSSTDDALRHNALQALEKVSREQLGPALPKLAELAKNAQEDKAYRVRAVRAIAKRGENGSSAVPDLVLLAGDDTNPELQRAIATIATLDGGCFASLAAALSETDTYFHCADYASYVETQERVSATYADPATWARLSILNVAGMGKFSIDRTVREYARDIWKAAFVPVAAP